MVKVINLSDLPADSNNPDGPTIREKNLELKHNIPIDSLVEVKYDSWYGDGACIKAHARLWVVGHHRDCDGTPLYILADKKIDTLLHLAQYYHTSVDHLGIYGNVYETGFSESSLTVVDVTESIKRGEDALCWDESD